MKKETNNNAPRYAPTMNSDPTPAYAPNGARYAPKMGEAPTMVSAASYTTPGAEAYPTATAAWPQAVGGLEALIPGGVISHVSGYQGPVSYDVRGRAFTDYGAYLREDGFYYPSGSTISRNGMYFDIGDGWQYGGWATARYPDGTLSKVPSSLYGVAPGTRIDMMDEWSWGGGVRASGQSLGLPGQTGGGTSGTGDSAVGGATVGTPATSTPTAEEVEAYLRLLEYSYNRFIQPAWEEETADRRGAF